jgi:hypothetical protein
LSDFNEFSIHDLEKSFNFKFLENSSNWNPVVPLGQTDGEKNKHMSKLITESCAFC